VEFKSTEKQGLPYVMQFSAMLVHPLFRELSPIVAEILWKTLKSTVQFEKL
jgi:hypothetical protein